MFPQFMTSETISDLDDDNIYNGNEFVFNDNSADYNSKNNVHDLNYYDLGKHGSFIKAQIQTIENIVKNTDWLDESPNNMIPVHKKALESEINQPATKWKTAVQDKKQELVVEHIQNISASKLLITVPS
jgi:hypothetical protein